MKCPTCGGEVASGLDHCPSCRKAAEAPVAVLVRKVAAASAATSGESNPGSDRHEKFFLVMALLVSAGALAIPRLRKSQAFGPTGKAILGTLGVLQTTAALVVLGWLIINAPELLTRLVRWRMGH